MYRAPLRQAVEILPYQSDVIPYKCELRMNLDDRDDGNLIRTNVMNVVQFDDIVNFGCFPGWVILN